MSEFDPAEYGIESHYRHWKGDKAEDGIGPFFFTMDGERAHTAFRTDERHSNAHDAIHGGILMTFADYTLCMAANGGAEESVVTISQNCEFAAPAFAGDILRGEGEVIRRGRSMVFVRAVLRREDESPQRGKVMVLNASAVVKRIPKDTSRGEPK